MFYFFVSSFLFVHCKSDFVCLNFFSPLVLDIFLRKLPLMDQSFIDENRIISHNDETIEICINDAILKKDLNKILMCRLKQAEIKKKKLKN